MNKMKHIILIFLLSLIAPLCFVITGCGATPIDDIQAVYFDSEIYDEETGYAVFELDYNVPTQLPYKVNPSGWSGMVAFNAQRIGQESAPYFDLDLETGVFKIIDEINFKTTEVDIVINVISDGVTTQLKDTCIVKMKKYPLQLCVNEERQNKKDVYLNANGACTLDIYGYFVEYDKDNKKIESTIQLSESDYKFEVTSSDPSTLSVPNSSRLDIISRKTRIDKVTVKVQLLNSQGEIIEGYSVTYNVIIVLPASKSFAYLDGYDGFIYDGDKIDIYLDDSINKSEIGSSIYYNLGFDIELLSDSGLTNDVYLEEKEYTLVCTSTEEKYRIIDNENKIFRIRKPLTYDPNEGLEVTIILVTSANNSLNNVYKMSFTATFYFL